jgi:hypothetical protein
LKTGIDYSKERAVLKSAVQQRDKGAGGKAPQRLNVVRVFL